MIKVLFLTHWYPSPDDPGHGTFIREHAKAIALAGAVPHILHIRIVDGGWRTRLRTEPLSDGTMQGTRITIASRLWKFIYILYPWQLWLVRKAIADRDLDIAGYDMVHSQVVHPSGVIGDALAEQHGKPHVISEHWTRVERYFKRDLLRWQGRRAYERAARIMPVSTYLAEIVRRYVRDPAKVQVVPNVVPSGAFTYKAQPEHKDLRFLMVARWERTKVPHKRPDLAIDAVASLQVGMDRQIRLTLIGKGGRRTELEQRAREKGVWIEMAGHRSKPQIAEELQQADLFLHPTERETFSVVVAEALKCGTPVVASNVQALPELVRPGQGVLVENTVDAWVEGIRKALASHYDRAAIARAWADRFTYTEVGERFLAIYRQVLHKPE
ncbi:MAG: glycosyltransferase [Flavobacteriales bacterium]